MSGTGEPKAPRRASGPPLDPAGWAAVGSKPLAEYDPGVLLGHFDRRPEGALDELGADILEHLMVIVWTKLRAYLPGDRNKARRDEVEGAINGHLMRRVGPVSFREHFVSAVLKEVGKHDQEQGRADARPSKALHGSVVETWLHVRDEVDPYERAHLKVKLEALLDGIADERHRRAVSMRLLEWEYDEIGEALGVSPRTARGWVERYVEPPPPVRRVWRAVRTRARETRGSAQP